MEAEVDQRVCSNNRGIIHGSELWVVTEKTRLWIQMAEMSFLPRVARLSLKNRLKSLDIRERLGVKLLLLHVEKG